MSSGIEGIGPWRYFFEQSKYLYTVLLAGVDLIPGGANEKINNIFGAYPYWSNTVLGQFVPDAHRLPFDSNILTALVAPVRVH